MGGNSLTSGVTHFTRFSPLVGESGLSLNCGARNEAFAGKLAKLADNAFIMHKHMDLPDCADAYTAKATELCILDVQQPDDRWAKEAFQLWGWEKDERQEAFKRVMARPREERFAEFLKVKTG